MALDWLWPQKSVAGQVVVVTGGGLGLGRMIALRFAALGAIVLVWDVNVPNGMKVVQEITSASCGGESHFYEVDVGNRVKSTRSGVKCSSNSESSIPSSTTLVSERQDAARHVGCCYRAHVAVNTLAHFWTVRAFLPDMVKRNRGHIVSISSAGGLVGFPNMTDYGATKFASYGFMCHLRQELRSLGKYGIHLTVVYPSFIKTGMFEALCSRRG